jgi:transcriptional regulator with XRE-family HTH domain
MKGKFVVKFGILSVWLTKKNWEQQDLAKALNCDESLISKWRSGEKHPSWQKLARLCDMTGLDIGDLLKFEKNYTAKTKEEAA